MERIATEGTLAHFDEVPEAVRSVFVCAHDIAPKWHMRMQAAFQVHCDASISKTINFPHSATVDDVVEIYRLAFELNCKGVTVYRDGCRKFQPMALKDADKKDVGGTKDSAPEKIAPLEPRVLPEIAPGVRVRQLTPFGNMHINITVDLKADRELEVFAQLGKGGDLANSDLEAICRMVSLWLRSGGSLNHVIRQLHSIGSSLQVHTKEGKIMSLGDGLARALQRYTRAKNEFGLRALLLGDSGVDSDETRPASAEGRTNGNGKKQHVRKTNGHSEGDATENEAVGAPTLNLSRFQRQQEQFKVLCPDCQGELQYSEGCEMCQSCGYAKC